MARVIEDTSFERARNQIATLALSVYQIHGLPAPSSDELGGVVARAEASMSLHQLRHPESISASAIAQIDQLVMSAAEAKKRPTNIYSADAARRSQGGEGNGKAGAKGIDPQDRSRAVPSGVRYRDGDGGASSSRSDSGARYDGIGSVEWGTAKGLAITRGYALSNDMAWATKQPDLMRMGKPALQALHEAHLKGDGYDKLHSPSHMHFDNPTIVAGAGFMKRNHLNYNEAAKAADSVYNHKSMTPEERARWRASVGGALHSKNAKDDKAAKDKLRDNGAEIKKAHPEMTPEVDRALKRFDASKGADINAEKHAENKQSNAGHEAKKAGVKLASFDALPDDPPKPQSAETAKPKDQTAPTRTAAKPAPASQPKPT